MDVRVLGFGGAEIGFEDATPDLVSTLLHNALDAGLNVIDTAECYLRSEELIGRAIGGRRGEYFLFTKCGHDVATFAADWRGESLLRSIERSLTRLRTDWLDLIQLHDCPLQELRKGDVIAALDRAREKGYARHIGYSGDGPAALYAVECGRFDVLQTSINAADQEAIDVILPVARQRQIGVIAKRPVANAVWRYRQRPTIRYHQAYWDRLRQLSYPFLGDEPHAIMATALRFTLAVPGVHTAIVGTKQVGRWRENAALLEAGPLPAPTFDAIRARWKEVAEPTWIGQG